MIDCTNRNSSTPVNRCYVSSSRCPRALVVITLTKGRFRIVAVWVGPSWQEERALSLGRDQVAPGVCESMDGAHQMLGRSEGDVCSHTVPFPFKLLLLFRTGVAKALTPTPPLAMGLAHLPALWGWFKEGRISRVLCQGPHSFRGRQFAWNACPFRSVRCTLVVPNGGLPTCFLEELPARSTGLDGRRS